MKRSFTVFLAVCMILTLLVGCAGGQPTDKPSLSFKAGTYTQEVNGMHGPITVEVTVDGTSIVDAKGDFHHGNARHRHLCRRTDHRPDRPASIAGCGRPDRCDHHQQHGEERR